MLLIDEIDNLPGMMIDDGKKENAEKSEILSALDGMNRRSFYFICTTNYPERINPTALRSGRINMFIHLEDKETYNNELEFQLRKDCQDTVAYMISK